MSVWPSDNELNNSGGNTAEFKCVSSVEFTLKA